MSKWLGQSLHFLLIYYNLPCFNPRLCLRALLVWITCCSAFLLSVLNSYLHSTFSSSGKEKPFILILLLLEKEMYHRLGSTSPVNSKPWDSLFFAVVYWWGFFVSCEPRRKLCYSLVFLLYKCLFSLSRQLLIHRKYIRLLKIGAFLSVNIYPPCMCSFHKCAVVQMFLLSEGVVLLAFRLW